MSDSSLTNFQILRNYATRQRENHDLALSQQIVTKSLTVNGPLKPDTLLINSYLRLPSARYSLKEQYEKAPKLNADILNATESVRMIANGSFEVLGVNATSASSTLSANTGCKLTTAGASGDEVIILPHLDAEQSAWESTFWSSDKELEWNCAITAADIADVDIWAGLKLTNTSVIATDDDQVFFRFSTVDGNTTWHVIESVAGVDVDTDSLVEVTADIVRFRISIDALNVASIYINDALVHITAALTTVNLKPYVGVGATAASVKTIHLHYQDLSRVL